MMDSSPLVYKNVKIVPTKQGSPAGWDASGGQGGADWSNGSDVEDYQAGTEMISDDDEIEVDFFDDRSECSTNYDTSDSEMDVVKTFKKRAHNRNLLPDDLVPETDFIDE
jgi:hypothetical protein